MFWLWPVGQVTLGHSQRQELVLWTLGEGQVMVGQGQRQVVGSRVPAGAPLKEKQGRGGHWHWQEVMLKNWNCGQLEKVEHSQAQRLAFQV